MATKKIEPPETATPKTKRCFFITPIGTEKSPARLHADWVYFHAIEPIFSAKGYLSSRADLIREPFMINDSVFEAITESDICVADLTLLNANVFYELGIRHALEKPVIHIAQFDTPLPFDNAGYRTIMFDRQEYQSMEHLKRELEANIDAIERADFRLSNPLTQFRGRERLSESADSSDQMLQSLQEEIRAQRRAMSALRTEMSMLRSPSSPPQNAWAEALLSIGSRPASAVESLRVYGADSLATESASAAAAAAAITDATRNLTITQQLAQIDRDNAEYLNGFRANNSPQT